MHIHIASSDGTAKFWLEPTVELANVYNMSSKELRKIEVIVQEYENEFRDAWSRHFSQ